MKRIIFWLLLVFSLAACGTQPPEVHTLKATRRVWKVTETLFVWQRVKYLDEDKILHHYQDEWVDVNSKITFSDQMNNQVDPSTAKTFDCLDKRPEKPEYGVEACDLVTQYYYDFPTYGLVEVSRDQYYEFSANKEYTIQLFDDYGYTVYIFVK